MIALSKLSKSYGGRTLFEDVSLQLNVRSRYGLVGANGAGKSTLMRVIAGDEAATDGVVSMAKHARVGVLRQDHFLDDGEMILRLAMMGDSAAWQLLEERALILDGGANADPMRLADIEHGLLNFDGYTLEARATHILEGLGIPIGSHRSPLSSLSGGFKLRVLLAQVLVAGPDILLLDEPTNHLDIISIRWLEKFLAGYNGVALVISHDRRFLNNIATHILDVDYGTVTQYTGNYAAFAIEKKLAREQKSARIANAEKAIAHKREFVERFGAKATKAKQAQSRLKQIEKIEVEELDATSRRSPLFRFQALRPSGRDVLDIASVAKAYGAKQVLRDVSLTIRRGEKVAIIGANGLGKSTLLKIVMGRAEQDAGTIKFGHEVRAGYFAQDHHELLPNLEATPLDYVWDACPSEGTTYVRGQLGRVLFSEDDINKSISSLSGGEAARLIFGRIIVEKPNLLILDEPTNHLDIEAIEALVEGLRAFDGTVVFVSHDRWFVSELATRIIEITATGLRDFAGTYAEFLERCGDDHLDADAALKAAGAAATSASPAPTDTSGWEEQKRRRNRAAGLPARRDKVLAAVEKAETEREAIHKRFAEPDFYERTSPDEMKRLDETDKSLGAQIDALMAEWESIEAELAVS